MTKLKPPPIRRPVPKSATSTGNKTFTVHAWTGENEGEKVLIYGPSGMGKTTLATTTPKPVFVGIDDGGRKIRNPITSEALMAVNGVESFEDVRTVLQGNALDGFETIVIDTVTELQHMALEATFHRVPAGKNQTAKTIEDYGFHKGYRHWYDTMRLVLTDCDRHVRAGRNIVLLAQSRTIRRANAGGEDFLQEAPDLYHDKNVSILDVYKSWVDHVFKLDYANMVVDKGKAGSSNERAVYVHPEIHFIAKSRTISADYPVVSFSEPADDSIWKLVFGSDE